MLDIGGTVDPESLRKVLGCFTTGVVVATTMDDNGVPVGLTVNSFNSVSLEPPLILWTISLSAPSLGAFRARDAFAINILSDDQRHLCAQFSRPSADKFAGVDYRKGYRGVPVLLNSLATLECKTFRRDPGGDHEIYIGEVVGMEAFNKTPLVVHRGKFAGLPDVCE
jgi:3-hydroxy-9,10-secoandrosta-1,3,5(10)-triene-9,17-dione monooxygenase reductase component